MTNVELRELAEAATHHGPWTSLRKGERSFTHQPDQAALNWSHTVDWAYIVNGDEILATADAADAAFIAACSPDVILRLLDRIDAMRATRENLPAMAWVASVERGGA